jgi:hypothetical protein
MKEGIRGREDVNRTPSSSGILVEQILCYQRGFFPTAEYQRWEYTNQGYIVTSYWLLGPLGPPAVARSQSNTHYSPERGGYRQNLIEHHWLHGYNQTHVLLKGEWLQTKHCLTPIVARDRNPAETQRSLGSAHTQNEAE